MKSLFGGIILSITALFLISTSCTKREKRVLIFSKTAGFRHTSIDSGKAALYNLCKTNGIQADTTENPGLFSDNYLGKYSAIIFLNTTGNILNRAQESAVERYIQAGGGFVGIHSATDTEYDWDWYCKMVGANFDGHPDPQTATIHVIDHDHPSTKDLPDTWKRKDEWYSFRNINKDIKVLATLDEQSYKGGKNGKDHPIAWYHEYDGGKAFYTGGGHTEESYKDSLFLQHVLGGIEYAIGGNKRDYATAHSPALPEENRFSKTVIIDHLEEPTELAIAPDGKVFFVERRGKVYLYDPRKETTRVINRLKVFWGLEDGLNGIALDPNFKNNQRVYLFYSPVEGPPRQHVSSFIFNGNSLDYRTEKVILQIPTQRETCCHAAGSMAFGPDGNLYIAVGDNTSSHHSNGYTPLDERPGRGPYDAQRTSGNTQDLRGKILRIHVNEDGSYSIPDGNLFPKNGSKGRPEIYVMGCRNPYRISIDQKNGNLFWGDVGPDAGVGSKQGPKAYDELNVATKAGNYGWPYFVGDNKPYPRFNFATGEVGAFYDPLKPVNNSVNNTGEKILPPAQKALVWYSYDSSEEFPLLGKAGRSAMAGPVYHFDSYKNSPKKFPKYYDNSLIFFEWMRDWMISVRTDGKGKLASMESMLEKLKFAHPIDMAFGPDGVLYVLEYGNNWFVSNPEAALSRIEYNRENRPPVVKMTLSDSSGQVPLKVRFSAVQSYDPDGDDFIYEWRMEGKKIVSREPMLDYTFTSKGVFSPSVTVTDSKGATSVGKATITSGNSVPQLSFVTDNNTTFYWDDYVFNYRVKVEDAEDKNISASNIRVFFDYLSEGNDMSPIYLRHQQNGKVKKEIDHKPILASDCKACHAYETKSIGPSFMQISQRYKTDPNATNYLAEKIIKGGSGVWTDQHAMSAHPQLSLDAAKDMVKYIISLSEPQRPEGALPAEGKVSFTQHLDKSEKGKYFLTAYYKDHGAPGLSSIEGKKQLALRHNYVLANTRAGDALYSTFGNTTVYMEAMESNAYIYFDNIDLRKIKNLGIVYSSNADSSSIEIRLDSPTGKLIAEVPLHKTGDPNNFQWDKFEEAVSPDINLNGTYKLYFTFKLKSKKVKNSLIFHGINFKRDHL